MIKTAAPRNQDARIYRPKCSPFGLMPPGSRRVNGRLDYQHYVRHARSVVNCLGVNGRQNYQAL